LREGNWLCTNRSAQTPSLYEQFVRSGEERYLFTTREGKPLDPRSVSRQFERAVAKACLPTISVHGLRHTHATIALQAGVHPKVVQERLGHASIAITLDTYSHVIPQLDSGAAALIADAVAVRVKEN
jgi:integrase